jgi:cell division septation protein DedD
VTNSPKRAAIKPKETPLPFPDFQEQYTILVGSFKSKENALALRQKFQNKGYPVYNYPIDFPGKGGIWYRVIIGNYKDLNNAKKMASELKAKEKKFPPYL